MIWLIIACWFAPTIPVILVGTYLDGVLKVKDLPILLMVFVGGWISVVYCTWVWYDVSKESVIWKRKY